MDKVSSTSGIVNAIDTLSGEEPDLHDDFVRNGLSRPAMNQEEFDRRFSYRQDWSEPTIGERAKKVALKSLKPCSSPRALWRTAKRRLPILEWLPNYSFRENIFLDIVGGVTIAIMNVPQGIAYSSLAGVQAQYGLYTSIFPALFYMIFGTSRHCSVGAFAVVALMAGNYVKKLRNDPDAPWHHGNGTAPEPIEIAATMGFTVAIVQLLIGLLRLDFITSYFSDEVVGGFTTGASVHVFSLQLKDLTGIPKDMLLDRDKNPFMPTFKRMYDILSNITHANGATLITSLCCLIFLALGKELISPFVKRKVKMPVPIPFELILMIVSILASWLLQLNEKHGVQIVGDVPSGLPAPSFVHYEYIKDYGSLITEAAAIAIVVIAIHISLAKMFAKRNDYVVDSKQELFALGISGGLSSLMSCYPMSCSLARTMVNSEIGTKTQLAGIFSCALLTILVTVAARLLHHLPMCVLAAIIIYALKNMFNKVGHVRTIWALSKVDASIFLVSFFGTACLDVKYGLLVSITYALFTTIYREQWPKWSLLANINGTSLFRDVENYRDVYFFHDICIFRFDSPMLFTNVERFKKAIHKIVRDWDKKASVRHLVIDCSGFTFIDTMGLFALKEIFEELEAEHVGVSFAAAKASVRKLFESSQLHDKVPKSCFYPTIYDAVEFAIRARDNRPAPDEEEEEGPRPETSDDKACLETEDSRV